MPHESTELSRSDLVSPIVRALVFSSLYLMGAELGHFLSFAENFASFWPPAGILLATLLLTNLSTWPAILVLTLFCNLISDVLLHGQSPVVSLGFWLANCGEALTAAWLMHRFVGYTITLTTLKEVIRLTILAALVGSTVGAVLGATVMCLAFDGVVFAAAWKTWWVANVLGIIVFTPCVVSLHHASLNWTHFSDYSTRVGSKYHANWAMSHKLDLRRLGEILILFTTLLLSSQVVFGNQPHPLASLVFPILFWIALRFETGAISGGNLILAVVAIWNTKLGNGPFAGDRPIADQILLLQSFLSVSSASSLVLAAVVAERRGIADVIQENEARYRDLFENVNDLVHSVDPDGRLLYANRAWQETLGYSQQELLQLFVFEIMHPDELPGCRERLKKLIAGENIEHWEARLLTKSGRVIIVEGSSNCRIVNGRPIATRAIFRDITKRREHERELESYRRQLEEANSRLLLLATTDGLTDLQNRRAFQARIQEEVERAQRYSTHLSLLLLDIDYFKQFNDTFGHPSGDAILKRVSRILEQTARASDFVARFGGEEFAIILPNTDRESSEILAERFREAIFREAWRERRISVSVGAATLVPGFPLLDECSDGSSLIQSADEALYFSKQAGRNRSCHALNLTRIEA